MRILVGIGHPGHVHFYRYISNFLMDRGHDVMIASRDKDVALDLLRGFGMRHIVSSRARTGIWGMGAECVAREFNLARTIIKYKPHLTTEIGGLFTAPISRLLRVPCVVFTDSEHVKADRYLTYPYATSICTPSTFLNNIGATQVRYNGYHELAYLHPKRFVADPTIREKLGLVDGEEFAIVRFVAWGASHDIGQSGFNRAAKRKLVEMIGERMRVFITSESPLEEELKKLRISIRPEDIHSAMFEASLVVGDGATMAAEAGILGTPSVYASSLVDSMGNFKELGNRYDLVRSFRDVDEAVTQCEKLLDNPQSKVEWRRKAAKMLHEKIDVAEWATDYLESVGC